MGRIRIGIGGWEHELLDDLLYGARGLSPEEKLSRYARHFEVTEIRPTFWDETLGPDDAAGWVNAVTAAPSFRFIVKLHRAFTHQRQTPPALRVRVREILGVLEKGGRLGTLLAQFPFSFTNTGTNRRHLTAVAELFRGFPLAIELRHGSWHGPATARAAKEQGYTLVAPDLPRLPQFLPFHVGGGADLAVLRLHGRNEKGWLLKRDDARYDYFYNARELLELRRRTEGMSTSSREVFVIFNNIPGGSALANALQLGSALRGGRPLPVPPALLEVFPQLRTIGDPSKADGTLFDPLPLRPTG
jgi:uncharacterized protein YecE (DUF72 family)